MPVFEIKPVFIDGTDAAAEWVDNEHSAWNEPLLRTTAPLAERWESPSLELYRSEKSATAVLERLLAMGVDLAQGYLLHEPAPIDQLIAAAPAVA